MEVLGIIPARGGSKNVPRKNIRLVGGQPLIAYTIECGQKARLLSRLIVTTDDKEIAQIAGECKAKVPFLRPKELAQDDTPDLPVFQHALNWLKENEKYIPELIVHLRPTSPLRKPEEIDSGIELLQNNKEADSVRSVCTADKTPYKMWRVAGKYLCPLLEIEEIPEAFNAPRQQLPQVYWQTASVDVIRYETIMKKNSMSGERIIPLIVPQENSIDLDTEQDFRIIEEILKEDQHNEK